MLSNHLIVWHPLLLLSLIFPSIRVLSNELALSIRWPKYWNVSFSTNPSNEYLALISFEIDWFGLPAVQVTRKSLSSVFSTTIRKHQFFRTQPSFGLPLQLSW